MKLYRWYAYFGRSGSLSGLFVVNERGEQLLREAIAVNARVYFGEVLGKHSDVDWRFTAEAFTQVEATDEEIQTICRVLQIDLKNLKHTRSILGWNPLGRMLDREEDEDE